MWEREPHPLSTKNQTTMSANAYHANRNDRKHRVQRLTRLQAKDTAEQIFDALHPENEYDGVDFDDYDVCGGYNPFFDEDPDPDDDWGANYLDDCYDDIDWTPLPMYTSLPL